MEAARDAHRLIEITGKPGVGKSWVLRHLAERQAREGHVIVLDPIGTPDGGWAALGQRLNVPGTARDFLGDIAASGGGVLFIDGVEMFATAERRRTVNDVLREVASIEGFSVVISTRPDQGVEGGNWLAEDALSVLGAPHPVIVGELDDDEVAVLIALAPELRVLLAADHPAAAISRNLYRLTQLLKVPSSVDIRTEAALADHWWKSADGAKLQDVRAAQRILTDLAEAALAGRDTIDATTDSSARDHLLRSLTLNEPTRDKLAFYHDVLRDWAIGARLNEDLSLPDGLDLTFPPSPRVARGIEFAGRLALEKGTDGSDWQALLAALSRTGAHDAWRRQALLAIVRSELSAELLARCSAALLAQGGALLVELCTAITAVETMSTAALFAQMRTAGVNVPEGQTSLRAATSPSAPAVLMWCFAHEAEIPIQAIGAVVKLVEIQFFLAMTVSAYGQAAASMLFKWLIQLDLRTRAITIPSPVDVPRLEGQVRQRLDDGRLTDGQGRTVDFTNTIIVLTSNLGSQFIAGLADDEPVEKVEDQVMDIVRAHFRPEFLNRLDEVILFHRLGATHMAPIVDIQVARIGKLLKDRKVTLDLTDGARAWLGRVGYDPVYGARPLKRAVQRYLQDPLADLILRGAVPDGSTVRVEPGEKCLDLEVVEQLPKAA
ncbi:hypothetical protein TomMM35A_04010 [Sphingobium sp. TomMM35A]